MNEPLRMRLDNETLLQLSVELEMTDKAIAELYGVDRTNIVHLRKRYGIPTRRSIGRDGELFALDKLTGFGFACQDMNETDKLSSFDILIDNEIRADVKTSRLNKDGYYHFSLSEKAGNGNKIGKNRIELKGGRTRKLYRKSCDILILVCWDNQAAFIIPSADIPDGQGKIVLSHHPKRYKPYRNNWEAIHGIKNSQLIKN